MLLCLIFAMCEDQCQELNAARPRLFARARQPEHRQQLSHPSSRTRPKEDEAKAKVAVAMRGECRRGRSAVMAGPVPAIHAAGLSRPVDAWH
ncbi:MAG: hypothetical protein CTY30_08505 [Methylocystis sp.]|nr:MAG: hypothetical protein CTY30_08505 [Methylocystis sp.]